MAFVVTAKESGKLLTGHDGKMTKEQAEARADKANTDAERLDIKSRYEMTEMDDADLKRLTK